ncbi:cytochrome P450 [Sinobacterium caligoides]|uniref:Cytochrome P450 n=1 Tax=Sinobacterium caligoides TaxID=933926 RepID=A0A3N2DZL3_9GAMM|nr:cytochrome P450 [Sinobacterium caligoides]ROS05306.1 cytochrome P450 [Sinobacterium caligoides]
MSTATIDQSYLNEKDNKNLDHIPGEYGLPFIGKTLPLLSRLHDVVDDHYKRFGEVSRVRLGGQNGLLVVGGDNYKQIFLDRDKNFSARMGYDQTLATMYPDTILTSDFEQHRPQRRMFQAAFKNDAMRTYVDMMNPVLEKNIKEFANNKNFVFFPAVKKTLLDVAAKVFVGIDDLDGEEASRLAQSFINSSEGLLAIVRKEVPGGKFKRGRDGIRYQRDFFRKLIKQRRGGNGTDTLTYLCNERDDDGNYFDEESIIDQIVFLLFAAHDTTTSALCHMVYYTGKNPQWQQRIREEAEQLGKPFLDYDDLDTRVDTDLVFQESLRMNPSVPVLSRRTIRDCVIGGHNVPANTVIWIAPTYNHRMTQYWTNPDQFDPERFAPERQEHKSHSFAYMPFGGGAHKCIGMHFAVMVSKAFMHQFSLNYDYSLTKSGEPKMDYFPLPKPHDGVPVQLKPRS